MYDVRQHYHHVHTIDLPPGCAAPTEHELYDLALGTNCSPTLLAP